MKNKFKRPAPARRLQVRRVCMAAAVALGPGLALADAAPNPAEALELPTVEVVGTTPLPGLGLPLRDVPANVQTFGAAQIGARRSSTLAGLLGGDAGSITLNDAQGNGYQPDIAFRGFTASPLLGTPQGLSVFQDGVRINEPFGDIVNWDLLPRSAIASVQLIPGSNPLFGLNTLGGAISVNTKSGSYFPGGSLELTGGSFGRAGVELQQGGASGPWDYFVTTHVEHEHGWAEHNPSRIAQLFAKLGYQTEVSDLDLSLTAANNELQGTQTLPLSWLDTPRQAYTWPDTNRNRLFMLALKGSRQLGDDRLLGGNLYLRRYRSSNLSSNVNGDYGQLDPATGQVDNIQATNDQSEVDQTSYGYGLQLTLGGRLAARKNQLVLGSSGDFAGTGFTQQSQPAAFTASRGTVGTGEFVGVTNAGTRNRSLGLFAMDTLWLAERWTLTASARYDDAQVHIADRSGAAPALNGDHRFRRLNPALGLNFNPGEHLTTYASFNQGMRAPTAMELTCADPQAPCKLPNAFVADPSLRPVVARTLELGARGKDGPMSWSAAVFDSELSDDIQFIGSGVSNAGYFQNVGRTRRQGLELSLSSRWRSLAWTVRYSRMDATYRSAFIEHSPNNASADANGNILVMPGQRIAGVPRDSFKLRLDYAPGEAWGVGANVVAVGESVARGDENQGSGTGKVPGYALVHLDGRYAISKRVEVSLRIDNVFDRRYANFGILGSNAFTGAGRSFDGANAVDEAFRGLGAPRGAWLTVRYEWP